MRLTPRGMDHGAIFRLLQDLANCILTSPKLAGQASALVDMASAFQYRIAGKVFEKAATDITLTTAISTGVGEFRKVRFEIDAAGTVSFVAGAVASAQALAKMPRKSSAAKVTFGWMEVPASFTGGTTLTNVAGVSFFNGDPDIGDGSVPGCADRGIEPVILAGS